MYHVLTTIYSLLFVCLVANKPAPYIRIFPMSLLFFVSGGQRTGALASASVLPKHIPGWFPLGLTHLILQSKGIPRVFFSATISKTEGQRKRECQRMRWLDSITDSKDWLKGHNLSKLWEVLKHRGAWSGVVHGVTKSWTRLNDWTTTTNKPTPLLSINYFWYLKHWHSLTTSGFFFFVNESGVYQIIQIFLMFENVIDI